MPTPDGVKHNQIKLLYSIPPTSGDLEPKFEQMIFEGIIPSDVSPKMIQDQLRKASGHDDWLVKFNFDDKFDEIIILSQQGWKAGYPVSEELKPKSFRKLLAFWELFPFILPSKTRREAYEPAYHDLQADFVRALKFKTSIAQKWLKFCFIARTILIVFECLRVWMGAKLRRIIWDSVTESFRKLSGG